MGKRFPGFVRIGAFCAGALLLSSLIASAGAADSATKALMATDKEWSQAAVARNLDRVASYYAEDCVAYPPNEPAAVGRAAARKVWAAYFADPTFQISWKASSAGAERRIGWTVGTYQASFKGPDGKTEVEKGKYVTVWRKGADGKWKAIHDIWNSDSK